MEPKEPELAVDRVVSGPPSARDLNGTVEAMVRTACALVKEVGTPEELVDVVCGASPAERTSRW